MLNINGFFKIMSAAILGAAVCVFTFIACSKNEQNNFDNGSYGNSDYNYSQALRFSVELRQTPVQHGTLEKDFAGFSGWSINLKWLEEYDGNANDIEISTLGDIPTEIAAACAQGNKTQVNLLIRSPEKFDEEGATPISDWRNTRGQRALNISQSDIDIVAAKFAAALGGGCMEIVVNTDDGIKGVVKFAGIRSSYYGFDDETGNKNFPTPDEAAAVMKNVAKKYGDDVIPSAVWIVGAIEESRCLLEFEPTQTSDPYITFAEQDKHTPYLNKFDEIGAKVYLQVEPGRADVKELIRLVMEKYSHHPSVAGFGIDVEWYPADGDDKMNPSENINVPLDTNDLKEFEALVKSYKSDFKIFVKHFWSSYVGGRPVGDVVYIDDSQWFSSINSFASEFAYWADCFYPNEVGFQIGYTGLNNMDYNWWSKLENPMEEMVEAVRRKMKNENQKINIYWVDFTIRYKQFDELWK